MAAIYTAASAATNNNTSNTTYNSNESPPREVNLMVSMHSSAFIVAIMMMGKQEQ